MLESRSRSNKGRAGVKSRFLGIDSCFSYRDVVIDGVLVNKNKIKWKKEERGDVFLFFRGRWGGVMVTNKKFEK